jgi:hypothetical protein
MEELFVPGATRALQEVFKSEKISLNWAADVFGAYVEPVS